MDKQAAFIASGVTCFFMVVLWASFWWPEALFALCIPVFWMLIYTIARRS